MKTNYLLPNTKWTSPSGSCWAVCERRPGNHHLWMVPNRNKHQEQKGTEVFTGRGSPSCISQAHHGQDPKHAATRHLQICAKHLAGFCWSLPVKTNLKVLLRLQEVHKNKATFPSPLTLTKPRLHHHFYLYNKSLQQQQAGLPVLMNARANGKMKPRKLLENDIFQPSVDITICHPASVPGLEMNEEAKTFLWIFFSTIHFQAIQI